MIIDEKNSKNTLKDTITEFKLKERKDVCESYDDLDIAPEERKRGIIFNTVKQENILKKSKTNKERN